MAKRTLVLNSFALPMLAAEDSMWLQLSSTLSAVHHLIMLQQLTLFHYDLFLY